MTCLPLSFKRFALKTLGNFGLNIQPIPNVPEDLRVGCLRDPEKLQISGLIKIPE